MTDPCAWSLRHPLRVAALGLSLLAADAAVDGPWDVVFATGGLLGWLAVGAACLALRIHHPLFRLATALSAAGFAVSSLLVAETVRDETVRAAAGGAGRGMGAMLQLAWWGVPRVAVLAPWAGHLLVGLALILALGAARVAPSLRRHGYVLLAVGPAGLLGAGLSLHGALAGAVVAPLAAWLGAYLWCAEPRRDRVVGGHRPSGRYVPLPEPAPTEAPAAA